MIAWRLSQVSALRASNPLCLPNEDREKFGVPDAPLLLARAACVGCRHIAPGYCAPVKAEADGEGMPLPMCSTTTCSPSPVLFHQAGLLGHILLLWLLLPLLYVSGKPVLKAPYLRPGCILALSAGLPPWLQMQASGLYDYVLFFSGGCKSTRS